MALSRRVMDSRFATSISALYFEYPSIEGAHLWGDVLLQMALEIFPEDWEKLQANRQCS